MRALWIACVLLSACAPLELAPGDELLSLEGTVTFEGSTPTGSLSPVLMFGDNEYGYTFVEMTTRGSFVPNLVADVYDTPPEFTLSRLYDTTDEPQLARAYIAAVSPDYPERIALNDSQDFIAGRSLNYWVIYLPADAPADSVFAQTYTGSTVLSAGYHLFEVMWTGDSDTTMRHVSDPSATVIQVTLGNYTIAAPF